MNGSSPGVVGLIDAHHHFFRLGIGDYPWMEAPEFAALRAEFGPAQFEQAIAGHDVVGSVLVQTWSSFEETQDYLTIANDVDLVCGVVGWVELTSADVADRIAELRDGVGGDRLVGIRHQVHDEADPDWLSRPDVRRGLTAVAASELVFDLLVRPRELPAALALAREIPDLRLVLDHAAKPDITGAGRSIWSELLTPLAEFDQVDCKISGLVTEADWSTWQLDDVAGYAIDVIDLFGADRCMFGSDWPVCVVAASYGEVVGIVERALAGATDSERSAVRAATARRAYRLARVGVTDCPSASEIRSPIGRAHEAGSKETSA